LSQPRLLIATNNRGKFREYSRLLQGIPFEIVSPQDIGIAADIEETGGTFEQNAVLKAKACSSRGNILTMADDSGLEVDALGGEPGVLSARYAGEGASQSELVDHLLQKLQGIPAEKRTARFVCVIAIASPHGQVDVFRGECPGVITKEPRGEGGFGYDPVFYLPELGKTMAEISIEEKNNISHRGQAAAKARNYLEALD